MKNYYDTLGLSQAASYDDIKKAYRKLSMKFHPDKNGNDQYFSDMFKRVTEAYETLSNDIKRTIYDLSLRPSITKEFDKTQEEALVEEIDELFIDAAALFVSKKVASLSMLQSFFRIDYQRARTIMFQLEEAKIVGHYKGLMRDVLVDKAYLESNYNYKFTDTTDHQARKKRIDESRDTSVGRDYHEALYRNQRNARMQRKFFNWFLTVALISVIIYQFKDEIRDGFTDIKRTHFNENAIRGSVNLTSGLQMRLRPYDNSGIMLNIPHQETVLIIHENGPEQTIDGVSSSWYKVQYDDREG